ncbi:unnamed protein product [Fructobacillus tropaeoli]|nr:unnamed protein product [Fructobacillus tropaeoli]
MFQLRQKDSYLIDRVIKKSDNEFDVFVSFRLGRKKEKKIRKFNRKLADLEKLMRELKKI